MKTTITWPYYGSPHLWPLFFPCFHQVLLQVRHVIHVNLRLTLLLRFARYRRNFQDERLVVDLHVNDPREYDERETEDGQAQDDKVVVLCGFAFLLGFCSGRWGGGHRTEADQLKPGTTSWMEASGTSERSAYFINEVRTYGSQAYESQVVLFAPPTSPRVAPRLIPPFKLCGKVKRRSSVPVRTVVVGHDDAVYSNDYRKRRYQRRPNPPTHAYHLYEEMRGGGGQILRVRESDERHVDGGEGVVVGTVQDRVYEDVLHAVEVILLPIEVPESRYPSALVFHAADGRN